MSRLNADAAVASEGAAGSAEVETGRRDKAGQAREGAPMSEVNVGQAERAVSVAAGSILALAGLSRGSLPGLLGAAVGGMLVHRGVTGRCRAYESLGIDTAHDPGRSAEQEVAERGIHVEQAFLINRPAEELYRFWRDLGNLPRVMSHLKEVRVIDDKRSHWVAQAPALAGGSVEWDAEVTRDEPGVAIAWRSLPGSDVDTVGEVRFAKALGDRGTEVHVTMEYVPPAGRVGHWVAKLFGKAPARQVREDLRSFKRLMELGEVLTTAGQPRGTCTGQGTYESR